MTLGIDTNILVRFLVHDDEGQFSKAYQIIKRAERLGNPVLVNDVVLVETEWVLRSKYGYKKAEVLNALLQLLETQDVRWEDEAVVEEAVFGWRNNPADFADCLIGARNRRAGCTTTVTFDVQASRLLGFSAA